MATITFEINSEYGIFRDAIALPDNHNFSSEQIEQMKQQRFKNWEDAMQSTDKNLEGE
jgi:hypothetical protein